MIIVIIHFPNAPPTPPSESAGVQRAEFKEGAKRLLKLVTEVYIMFQIIRMRNKCWKDGSPFRISIFYNLSAYKALFCNNLHQNIDAEINVSDSGSIRLPTQKMSEMIHVISVTI